MANLEIKLARQREFTMESEVSSRESAPETTGMLSEPLNNRYRCPEKFLDFGLNERLSPPDGYFRFGRNAVCYGRSCSGTRRARPEYSLYDAVKDVIVDDGKLSLPFDPTEIIDNLRMERYANTRGTDGGFQQLLRRLYYGLRPFTNRNVRRQIQKFHARNWKEQPFPKWPVDTTVEDICESLLLMSMEAKGVDRVPFVWFWPDGANACLMMTHDVETRAGRDYCPDLMRLDESFGIKAAFGIVPEERYEVPSSLLERMRNQGFEVHIQDLNHDGRLFDNKEEFLRRAKIINRYGREYGAKGFRAAVLYRNPEWYEALDFDFDMSVPNVARLDPQRGGCCTVMPYFIGNILELPVTTIQDYTLFHVLGDRSCDLWKTQAGLILEKNGLMSFIVHPDYVIEQDTHSVYENLLSYLRELREKSFIWSALPAEVNWWWRARSRMSVVKDGCSWRIEGDNTRRARLAYAKVGNGKLVYELA